MRSRRLGLLAAAALTLVLGACGVTDTPVPAPPAPPEVSGGAAPVAQDCDNRLQSYAPGRATRWASRPARRWPRSASAGG